MDSSLPELVMADNTASENWNGGRGVGTLVHSSYSQVAVALELDDTDDGCSSSFEAAAADAIDAYASKSLCRAAAADDEAKLRRELQNVVKDNCLPLMMASLTATALFSSC